MDRQSFTLKYIAIGGNVRLEIPRNHLGCWPLTIDLKTTEGENQTLAGAIPFCGEYPGPRFEDKFRSANQIDGISIVDGGKMADS